MFLNSRLILGLVLCFSFFYTVHSDDECDKLPSSRARRFCREKISGSMSNSLETTTSTTTTTTPDPFDELEFEEDLRLDQEEEAARQDLTEITNIEDIQDFSKFNLSDSELGLLLEDQNSTKKKGPEIFIEKVESNFYDEDYPDCNSLPQQQRKPSVNCKEVKKPVIRWRDPVFERLLPQVWRDYQKRMRFDRQLYGTVIDPFVFGNYSYINSNFGLLVDLKFDEIQFFGLSSIYLVETLVTRPQDLTDLNMKMSFRFDELYVNGSYVSDGYAGWTSLNSNGKHNFEIRLLNATISPTVTLNSTAENRFGCGEGGGSVNMDISLPMTWNSLNIVFHNIGSAINSLLNVAATTILNTQERNLAGLIKDHIKKEINSLICSQD